VFSILHGRIAGPLSFHQKLIWIDQCRNCIGLPRKPRASPLYAVSTHWIRARPWNRSPGRADQEERPGQETAWPCRGAPTRRSRTGTATSPRCS